MSRFKALSLLPRTLSTSVPRCTSLHIASILRLSYHPLRSVHISSSMVTEHSHSSDSKHPAIDPSKVPLLSLNTNNLKMPQICFGTRVWTLPSQRTHDAIVQSIESGYRSLDTHNVCANEHAIGDALNFVTVKKGIVKREELWIQSKLWNANHRPEHVRKDLMQTLVDLRTDYLDSYLIHWPQASPSLVRRHAIASDGAYPAHVSKGTMFPFDDDGYFVSDDGVHFTETWEAMQALVSEGIVRSIGVCNFNRAQISEILAMKDCKYPPAIVQNESHPYLQQKDLIDFCNIHKIVFQAFSALGSGVKYLKNNPSPSGTVPLYDEYIEFLAKKHHKTTAQIIMRWHVQRNRGKCGLVAKTFNFERIRANINIFDFELDEQDMAGFDALNYGWRHLHFRSTANHCDYPFKDELPYNFKPEKAPVEF